MHRLAFVWIALLLGLWIAFSANYNNEVNNTYTAYERTENVSGETGPPTTPTDPVHAPSIVSAKERNKDLKAQEDMAFWAMIMTVLTFAGVLLIGRTLIETKEILRATQEATTAARDNTIEAKRIGEAQIAPSLCLSDWDFKLAPKHIQQNGRYAFTGGDLEYALRNTGNSPAINIHLELSLRIDNPTEERERGPEYAVGHSEISDIHSGRDWKHTTVVRYGSVVSETLHAHFMNLGLCNVCLNGTIKYDDNFGNNHETNIAEYRVLRYAKPKTANDAGWSYFEHGQGRTNHEDSSP